MSQVVIEKVGSLSREESADVNRSVLRQIVPQARRTFQVITPQRRTQISKMFFSRQQKVDSDQPERWSIYGRWIWFLAGIYFTSRKRGEMLIEHFNGVVTWLRETHDAERTIVIRRDFWTIDEDTACLRAARHSAKAGGDEAKVLELTQRIVANEREIRELQQFEVRQWI